MFSEDPTRIALLRCMAGYAFYTRIAMFSDGDMGRILLYIYMAAHNMLNGAAPEMTNTMKLKKNEAALRKSKNVIFF